MMSQFFHIIMYSRLIMSHSSPKVTVYQVLRIFLQVLEGVIL